ncbi:MAG: hypothetical protein WCQ86_03140 [Bacteroidaceae bacterium]
MKRSTFKLLTIITLSLGSFISAQSQEDSTNTNSYIHNIKRYKEGWERLIPQYYKVQYAGSIGLVSIGVGWSYCKERLETDLLWGIVPQYDDSRSKLTFTIREQYIPFHIILGDTRWSVEPLTASFFMNTILDGRFWEEEPKGKYPSSYYNFSTKVRFNLGIGQQITLDLPTKYHKSVSFYYQLSSCDLYIASYATNKYLKLKDILSLAFGVKVRVL